MTSYRNVYAYLPDSDDMKKLQLLVGAEDKDFLSTLVPDYGFTTYLVSRFVQSICADFRRAGLTHYDPTNPAFEELIDRTIKHRLGLLPAEHEAFEHSATKAHLPSDQRDDSGRKSRGSKAPKGSKKLATGADTAARDGLRSRRPSTVSQEKGSVVGG